jgi:DivIVA domain-containing protein
VTQQHEQHPFPYYRSADDIRRQEFAHRVRGLDEHEVHEYLDLLADQVRATEIERAEYRADNERLRAEVERLRSRQDDQSSGELSPQAVALFSQAQQVADQLVEEAVHHARDLMTSARNQQREILQRAHEAADNAVRMSAAVRPDGAVQGYVTPVQEIEYVRTFARVAQIQLRSVLDALTEQVDRLGEVPKLSAGASADEDDDERFPAQGRADRRPEEAFVIYPQP